jgi:hypothetical protein
MSMSMKITIPETLSEVTLKQWIKYTEAVEKHREDEAFLQMQTVAILCNLRLIDVNQMKLNDFQSVLLHLTDILQEKPKRVESFKIAGVEYGFIPNFDDITAGEYIDLDRYLSKDEYDPQRAMAVLYRPITYKKGKTYEIEPYTGSDAYSFEMAQAPASAFLGALDFFLSLGQELLSHIPAYIKRELKKMTSEERMLLEKNGVGISQLTQSLEDVFSNIQKRLN